MELYTDSDNRLVTLKLPVMPINNQLDVVVSRNGVSVYEPNLIGHDGTQFTFTFPYALMNEDGQYQVDWSFMYMENGVEESLERTTYVDVVRPILDLDTIQKILGPDADDDEVADVEKAVRFIIQAHTGQQFGYGLKSLTVQGAGDGAIRLPERLVELTGLSTLTATLNTHTAIITSDGWYLKKSWSDSTSTMTSDDLYFSPGDDDWNAPVGEQGYEKPDHGYVIRPPGINYSPTPWRTDYPFTITGYWGYKEIPGAVIEAAKLLVNDYACQEIAFRDRYLESFKAADFRLQFNVRAWESTGNVRADQLLSDYVLLNWAVV